MMVNKPFTVNLNEPLVFQVGHLGEAYNEWVHQPTISKEVPRFFKNDFCEVWTVIRILSTPSTAPALFGGILLGYVVYDVTHYYLHHGKPSKGLILNLKRYHLVHHFRVESMGFGVTSSIWDKVFGTLPSTKIA